MNKELEHLKIEADHVALTGSDDFDVPTIASRVRRGAGMSRATPSQMREVAIEALDAAGVTGEERDARLAAVDKAIGSLA